MLTYANEICDVLHATTVTNISSSDAMSKWWDLILYRVHEFSKNSNDAPNQDGRKRKHQIRSREYLLQAQYVNMTRNPAPAHHLNDVDVLMAIAKGEVLLATVGVVVFTSTKCAFVYANMQVA